MTLNEFKSAMTPFVRTFGAENYPPTRMELIFEVVKELPFESLQKIVKNMIGEFKPGLPPKRSHFREWAETELKELKQKQTLAVIKNPQAEAESSKKSYSKKEEALEDVQSFYRTMSAMKTFPAETPEVFWEVARKIEPGLVAEVEWLKKQVLEDIAEFRAEYVKKAQSLIIKVAWAGAWKNLKSATTAGEKESAAASG